MAPTEGATRLSHVPLDEPWANQPGLYRVQRLQGGHWTTKGETFDYGKAAGFLTALRAETEAH